MSELFAVDYELPGSRPAPGPWVDQAACLGKPPEWFFPTEYDGVPEEALDTCRACPVQQQCLEHAVRVGESYGIWGGKSAKARARIRRNARRGAAA